MLPLLSLFLVLSFHPLGGQDGPQREQIVDRDDGASLGQWPGDRRKEDPGVGRYTFKATIQKRHEPMMQDAVNSLNKSKESRTRNHSQSNPA
jgi:hypothetical protein